MDNILTWVTTNKGKDIREGLHRPFFPPSSDAFDVFHAEGAGTSTGPNAHVIGPAMLEPVWSDVPHALRSFRCELVVDGIHIDIPGRREVQRTRNKSGQHIEGPVYDSDAVHAVTSRLYSEARHFSINAAAHVHRPYSSQLNYRFGAPLFKKADVSNDNDCNWLVMLLLYPFTDEKAAHKSKERSASASQGTEGDNSSPPELAKLDLAGTEPTEPDPAGRSHAADEGAEPAHGIAVAATGSIVVTK
ncbi:hypothetical protein HDU90_003603 [Geranomyces variabilis]|nr:hypothetical protein HDU90_003603 [Geranomyces variabilis]